MKKINFNQRARAAQNAASKNAWAFAGRSMDHCTACALAFVAGASATLLQTTIINLTWLSLLAIGLIVCCCWWYFVSQRNRGHSLLTIITALVLGLLWANFQFSMQLQTTFPSVAERTTIQVTGEILGLPTRKHRDIKFQLRVIQSELAALVDKRLQLSCYRCSLDIQPGQTWAFSLRLKKPNGYASWGAFDFEKYLFRHKVIARGYVRLKDDNQLLTTRANTVHKLRAQIRQRIDELELSSQPGVAVILALTLGDKSGLSRAQREQMQISGVSHLMAISGLHIGLVFVFVRMLCGYLLAPFAPLFLVVPRQKLVLLPALFCAVSYAAMAGFAVSTQRAMLMLLIFVLCRLFLRNVSLFKVLALSAFTLVLIDAGSILDAGFWLSCGAVLVIALISTGSAKVSLVKLQPQLWLGMLPLSSLIFGQISLLSPIVNLLLVPLFCVVLIPATLLAVVLLQLGAESLGGTLLTLLAYLFTRVFSLLAWLATLPMSRVYTVTWSLWQFGALGLVILCHARALAFRIISWLILLGLLFYSPANRLTPTQLEVSLLDVGQGLAMVVRDAEHVLVYDTGPRYGTGFSAAEAVLLPFLRARGVRHIDTLIISHADNDHIGGLQIVRDAFSIDQILSSRPDKVSDAELCEQGQAWEWRATQFEMLSPNSDTPPGSNNLSCVLKIRHAATTLLITGDIEKQVERYLIEQQLQLTADVMLVPHQGSKTSSTSAFLDAVGPSLALLAAGYKNHYGHPQEEVMQRYRQRQIAVESTIEQGTVVLTVGQTGVEITRYRQHAGRFWHR